MKKVFIDGSEGTTGLRIFERFVGRDDIELLKIPSEQRKNPDEIKKYINASDITFLCLPDAAAQEAVAMVENENVIIIDTSTAHRTKEGWAYGYPELSDNHRNAIKTGKRIAVPGCYATGFITIIYPLVAGGILSKNYPVSAFAMSGYSGAGKKTIAIYEAQERDKELDAPREYALTQNHKHLKEMQKITGLDKIPLFSPIICDYYSGMLLTTPFYTDMLIGNPAPEKVHAFFQDYYAGEKFVKVMPFGKEAEYNGFLAGNACSGWDGIEIYITGNEERLLVSTRFDNLGKGASGAAIQCMNILLGCEEDKGLIL
ncbi:MAG: N-acetyl-gamma-glutamyl-phosphate reductase [Lachnospiraceae bacterium]|jgi:N-acetyl-gamma-glutamyl-phosphate reductase|nr:N-acetyl-gamma-glutamyl-phosphate reductase [Lachnospiraceae bacterium]